MDMNDPSVQADGPCSVRLHVAGLGSSVISSDLVQIFSSLAKVWSVDLVHSKGRNFAYVTLEAASPNIKRLFSLYNGCMWKGGRLKLEKAKEFYLDKLHREWADRDCLQKVQTPKLNQLMAPRSVANTKGSSGFKIYIPKLRKVKTIPEKGLGKHKRSFERVDPLPYSHLQNCNCEEHGTTTSNDQSGTRKALLGMAEEFTQDAKSATTQTSMYKTSIEGHPCYEASGYKGRKGVEKGAGVHWKSGDAQSPNEVSDFGGPVLAIKRGTSHSEVGVTECETDIDEPVKSQHGVEGRGQFQRKCLKPDPDAWASNENRPRKRVKPHLDTSSSVVRKHICEPGEITDVMSQRGERNESKVFQKLRSRSWVQKASWKSLVGETGLMMFSLGNMLEQNLTGNS